MYQELQGPGQDSAAGVGVGVQQISGQVVDGSLDSGDQNHGELQARAG